MLCCVCLKGDKNGIGIFNKKGKNLNIARVVEQHLWFKPQPKEESLSSICNPCWNTLCEFHEFYQQAERAHAEHQLRKKTLLIKEESEHTSSGIKLESDDSLESMMHLDTQKLRNSEITENENTANQPFEQKNEELRTSIDSYFENSEENLGTKETANPLDEADYVDSDDDIEKEFISDDYEPSEISDANESCSEKEDESIKESKEQEHKNKRKRTRTKKLPKNFSKNEPAHKKKRNVLYKFDQKHTDEMITKHIPMGCSMCVFVGKTFSDIVVHFKETHPKTKPYIMCCDKKLTKRFYVAQHALKHEDPNCFHCLECNKSFTTTCGLRAHNLNYHASEEERIYGCDLCPKKFAKSNLLELHKSSHIPKDQWQYFCTKCPTRKSFASEYLLNVHTSMRHKRAINVCHVCGKEIRDKHSFEKHVRQHFEDSGPRIPCPYPECESWLKDEDNLRQHLKRHNPEGVTYKCSECDKICKNRRALTNHKRYTHSPETFSCEQCDKTFKKSISLREHMTQHTGEVLYKCPFCPRTFNSNANMHAHKKRLHPIEWEEWRRNKKGSAQVLIAKSNIASMINKA